MVYTLSVEKPRRPTRVSQSPLAHTAVPAVSWTSTQSDQLPRSPAKPPLALSRPSDPTERDADAVADRIVGGGRVGAGTVTGASAAGISRKCDGCAREDEEDVAITRPPTTSGTANRLSRKCDGCAREDEEGAAVMRAPTTSGMRGDRMAASAATSDAVRSASTSGGAELPQPFRGHMESVFGRSLAHVRIHTDSESAQLSHDLHAQAFTHRSHIFLGAGQFDTVSVSGRHLLAHELVHVLQNRGETAISRQVEEGRAHAMEGEQNMAAAAGVPFEKWSEAIEEQYRQRGDSLRANAIHDCRTHGGEACDRLKTAAQMHALYALGKEAHGDAKIVEAGLPAIDSALAAAAAAAKAVQRPPLRLLPTPPPEPAPGTLPIPIPVAAAALIALLVSAEMAAIEDLGKFQAELRNRGFIVLEDPQALCVGGCHIPQRVEPRSRFGGLLSPQLDRETAEKWLGQQPRTAPAATTGTGPGPGTQPQTPTPSIGPAPGQRRHANQTCDNATLDALQKEMHRICDKIPGESCSPSKVSPKRLARRPCSQILQRNQALRECLQKRQLVQDECFGGKPDPDHIKAMAELTNGLNACVALEAVNCAPGHPMAGL